MTNVNHNSNMDSNKVEGYLSGISINYNNISTHIKVNKDERLRKDKRLFRTSDSNIFVLHTVVGVQDYPKSSFPTLPKPTVKSTLATYSAEVAKGANPSVPHFTLGEGELWQHRPIGFQCSALRSQQSFNPNTYAEVQVELVELADANTLWLPNEHNLIALYALLAFSNRYLNIPLSAPNNFPDDLSDMKGHIIASNNMRRRWAAEGNFPKISGVWEHLEIPFQYPTWHYDCGKLQRSLILKESDKYVSGVEFELT